MSVIYPDLENKWRDRFHQQSCEVIDSPYLKIFRLGCSSTNKKNLMMIDHLD